MSTRFCQGPKVGILRLVQSRQSEYLQMQAVSSSTVPHRRVNSWKIVPPESHKVVPLERRLTELLELALEQNRCSDGRAFDYFGGRCLVECLIEGTMCATNLLVTKNVLPLRKQGVRFFEKARGTNIREFTPRCGTALGNAARIRGCSSRRLCNNPGGHLTIVEKSL